MDRDGTARRFPLLSASIAAVEVDGRRQVTAEQVADALRETKRAAKAKAGCSCMLASGDRITDLSSRVSAPVVSGLSQMGLFAVGST
jgi:glyceraldehyde-3-phosphate dehydrogenase/erythrose-4-phosphate dehydrogenase